MADQPSELDDLTLDLRASSSPRPAAPPWLTEAVLVLRTWWTRWLPLPLVTSVRVERGRAGKFEVLDFVLVLLAYAVSGAATLHAFYEQARPAARALMGLWQRHALPSPSALSRFLGDVSWTAVESLRTLFLMISCTTVPTPATSAGSWTGRATSTSSLTPMERAKHTASVRLSERRCARPYGAAPSSSPPLDMRGENVAK
jgi:hypothetical protein